jgi:hypothetical protein
MPEELLHQGAKFNAVDREDAAGMADAIGVGVDLLVDCACRTAAHAASLVPMLGDVGSTVMISDPMEGRLP